MRKRVSSGLSLIALFTSLAVGQTSSAEWRKTPQTLLPSGSDSVPVATRACRDGYFDFRVDKDVVQGNSFTEIPLHDTTVLAQFASYQTIRSRSQRSIYTAVSMNVEEVVNDPSGTVRPGSGLTVLLEGGTLRLPSGQIVRQTPGEDERFGIQPGHRYLGLPEDQFMAAIRHTLAPGR